jgi:hypothetical protein
MLYHYVHTPSAFEIQQFRAGVLPAVAEAGIYDMAAVGGSMLVVVMGLALFWSSLGPVKPF